MILQPDLTHSDNIVYNAMSKKIFGGKKMKTFRSLLFLILSAGILSACANIPVAPTKTPTMSPEQMQTAAVSTAEAMRRETETQWAIDNPSPTPTETSTPTPEPTATSAIPVIPPTATEQARPYYHVDDTSVRIYEIGHPENWSDFVPRTDLYIEVCVKNGGSGVWNENYFMQVGNLGGANIQPRDPVYLGRDVAYGEWACFSFNNVGSTEFGLGQYCPFFQMYSDQGTAIRNANAYACWTIH